MKLTLTISNYSWHVSDIPLIERLNQLCNAKYDYQKRTYLWVNEQDKLSNYSSLNLVIRRPGSSIGVIVPKLINGKLYVDKIIMDNTETYPDNISEILTNEFKDFEIEIRKVII